MKTKHIGVIVAAGGCSPQQQPTHSSYIIDDDLPDMSSSQTTTMEGSQGTSDLQLRPRSTARQTGTSMNSSMSCSSETEASTASIVSNRRKQSRIHLVVMTPTRAEQITQKIAHMIAMDMQPISLVTDPGFKELITFLAPGYNLPSRTTMVRRIKLLADDVESDIRQKLHSVQDVSLTIDSWTSNHNESYLAVTVHYIDDSWSLRSYLIDIANMPERHTSDNLQEKLDGIIHGWNLEDKVVVIVHDNAANMIAAVRNMGRVSLSCTAHNLQLSISRGLEDPDVANLIQKASAIVSHFNHSTIATTELEKRQAQLNLPVLRLIQVCSHCLNYFYVFIC